MPNTCKCGRTWTHCPVCGSRNLYRKKYETEVLSRERGRVIEVYTCKKHGGTINTEMECQVPPEIGSSFIRFTKEAVLRPQDILDVNSIEFQTACTARCEELMARKGMTIAAAVRIMQLEGWKIELEPEKTEQPTVNPTIETEIEPMSLEDIVNAMKGKK